MLYYTKELVASAMDPNASMNPFIIGKLPVTMVNEFNFNQYMGYIDPGA